MSPIVTNQHGANAGRDIVGRDNTNNYTYNINSTSNTIADPLIARLCNELQSAIDEDATIADIVENLSIYKRKRNAKDGVVGLEQKLNQSNREHLLEDALEQKQRFVELLNKWSLYASAQEIFAHLLATAKRNFATQVYCHVDKADNALIDKLTDEHVVKVTVQMGSDIPLFTINTDIALGLLYWLAEQCLIKWHK
ncbi:ABC-three component system protein [Pseudovibrio brasiliensis]|uniref:ABC-three component systems C-terminal domain-containing protein n=1 Tax=Pseudovibrio brasiliensis TaxID=1898042 RepID=A0ABX8AQN7_9HYPH|nr:ABC-three component system protein [Pseudovibrio brasiliensis]QUS57378.1 hypothetical protein KGB56_08295 [Pseudovibrio brasiliensis]